ncbi:MAG: sigma-54 dependent transcriptional regulator [Candidatus Aminicenantes bacterium]|nr:sigma-54 dependent transcriptional regulator [Candidatus Aminicenantes bacterium]MDH5467888.1 sigma-54 dependent transcriptional regulator [Candidatus Aminicenantes bacterium]
MNKDKILVIDDEAGIRSSLKGILEDEGYSIKTVVKGEDALQLLKRENFDLILLDIWLPEMNGIEILKKIKNMDEAPRVVMISGHGTVETAVKAIKLGAYDFLEKPLSLEKVILTVQNALKQKKLEEENIRLRESVGLKHQLIGKSHPIQKLREEIMKAAPTNASVLIYGEEGTGKELVARLIHHLSSRKSHRFIPINFSAIPDDLIETELFGYARGNLENAEKDKKGKLLLADGGTIFLDEICDMSLNIQDKLFRVIEEQQFEPLGSNEPIPVDIRIISATNRAIHQYITKAKFREDLFLRLNVIPLTIPPLRERKEDIPLFIDHFLEYFSIQDGKKTKKMSEEAMEAFLNYSWPRNVSELINVIERFVIIVTDDEIKDSHLSLLVESREPESIPEVDQKLSLKEASQQFEKEYIHKILVKHKWDLAKTAAELEMNKTQLSKKIKKLAITFFG